MSAPPFVPLRLLRYAASEPRPRWPILASKALALLGLLSIPALLFVPFQQTVAGAGKVVAFSPTERQQHVEAPVSGRIVRWHVVEGSQVKVGDPIVDLVDIDPLYLERLDQRLNADRDRIEAARERLELYQAQTSAYEQARDKKVEALRLKVKMAQQKLKAAEQKLQVAEASEKTARTNLERQKSLFEKGIVSARQIELLELDLTKAEADYSLGLAAVSEARASLLAEQAEVLRAEAEGSAKVATARAEMHKAESERAYARSDLTKLEGERARQLSQTVVAPVDGTVVGIDGNLRGGVVKAGQHLARLVPKTKSRAIEMFVVGNDAPLITEGSPVRVQFEGWPAVQFVGWPSVAVGTFGGRVTFVDPAATDDLGRVRVLVQPDPNEPPWPSAEILRQQVRARAWILLQEVSLGRELWRRLNGFPPALLQQGSAFTSKTEPTSSKEKQK